VHDLRDSHVYTCTGTGGANAARPHCGAIT
jgi:hypothetical protein